MKQRQGSRAILPPRGMRPMVSRSMQEHDDREHASESLQETLERIRVDRLREHKPEPIDQTPRLANPVMLPDPPKRVMRKRAERGVYMTADDDALLAQAQIEADQWVSFIDSRAKARETAKAQLEGHVLTCDDCEIPESGSLAFAKLCGPGRVLANLARDTGETANRVPKSRKRSKGSGAEITEHERRGFKPVETHTDPPVRIVLTEWPSVNVDREPERANDYRRTDVYLGDDYSLPYAWYGDAWGVSRHYAAVDGMAFEHKATHGDNRGARTGNAVRIIPTGPVGTMRWLTTRRESMAKPRKGRPRGVMVPVTWQADTTALFASESAHVQNQRIELA